MVRMLILSVALISFVTGYLQTRQSQEAHALPSVQVLALAAH
jgi:hypothetical protein